MHTLFDDAIARKPDWISFEFGAPNDDLLPLNILQEASKELFSSPDSYSYSMQYGPQLGDELFRKRLAEWLKEQGLHNVESGHFCLTNGASQSLANIINLFTNQNTIVLVENPTYFIGIRLIREMMSSNKIVSCPGDSDGLDLEILEDILEKESKLFPKTQPKVSSMPGMLVDTTKEASKPVISNKKYNFLLYLVPTFSNPSGHTLSLEKRYKLVELARKYDCLIVCDDVYQLLPFSTCPAPTKRLVECDLETIHNQDMGNVISNQSFSKILGPGMRLGWVEASPFLIRHFSQSALLASGGSQNHFTSVLVSLAMKNNSLSKHMDKLKRTLEERCTSLCNALDQHLPKGCEYQRPKGGFFIWIKVPFRSGITATDVNQLLNKPSFDSSIDTAKSLILPDGKLLHFEKVSFAPGQAFSSLEAKNSHHDYIRLSFAMYDTQQLVLGSERLGKVLHSCV